MAWLICSGRDASLWHAKESGIFTQGGMGSVAMGFAVALGAEGDEVGLVVVAKSAAGVEMVDLKVGRPAAVLAAPAIALQHLLAKSTVGLGVEAKPGPAREQASHEAFLSCSRNCFCCGGGRN